MTDASFAKMCTKTINTYRQQAIVGGKGGALALNLQNVPATPLHMLTYNRVYGLLDRDLLDTPMSLRATMVEGELDIIRGDAIEMDGVQYPVRQVGNWPMNGTHWMHIVVEVEEGSD